MNGSAFDGLRKGLWPLAPLYGAVVAARNWMFDAGIRQVRRLPVPVVSVGNLTVGGTGKTPMIAWLAEAARRAGKVPGVLARGYGRARGAALNDEGELLARRFPDLLQEQDPDRYAGGLRLIERGADVVLLDDGFQHRHLHRDVDLVCMDALQPFGRGGLLPAGDLREGRRALRRADLVVLTRAGRIDEETFERRVDRLRRRSGKPGLPVLAAEHVVEDLVRRPGGETQPAEALRGRRVYLMSGIAGPDRFADTVRELGAEIAGEIRYPDHHRYTAAEVRAAADSARALDAVLVTTEKDDARLGDDPVERLVVRVEIAFITAEPAGELLGWA